MKGIALITVASIASASAFAPQNNNGRVESIISAKKPVKKAEEKKSLFQRVFEMDLYEPVKTQNDYGARNKKKLDIGTLSSKSYVPAGLTKAQYEAVRKGEVAKKAANYQKNVAKAGKFLDYTKFYLDRGTDIKQDWIKTVTRGHTMAKTKYDWSGSQDQAGANGYELSNKKRFGKNVGKKKK